MIGRTIDRYKIIAKIGEGAMGSVWKAEDPVLGRDVALKFLPPSVAQDPDARKRFLRGARAASVLNHPGIASVFDAGEVDGQVYIAFELVNGRSLQEHLRESQPTTAQAVEFVLHTSNALGHAHSKQVLHRDIKPANIMVTHDGKIVVVDFGLARLEEGTTMTETGTALGTPAYMAPEMWQARKSDRRADLYGLGVVFYELLTGRLPFHAERQAALGHLVLTEEVRPPSEHNPEVPPQLDAVVLKLLAKKPQNRYQRAGELVRDLRAFQNGTLTAISVTTIPKRRAVYRTLRRAPRRRSVQLALAAFVIVAAFATWRMLPRSTAYSSVAVLPLQNLNEDPTEAAWLAEGISQALATKLTHVSGIRVSAWVVTSRYKDLSQPLVDVAKALKVDALIIGQVRVSGNRIEGVVTLIDGRTGEQVWAEDFEESKDKLFGVHRDIAIGVAQKLRGELTGEERESLSEPLARTVDAFELYERGALVFQKDNREASEEAMGLFTKALALDPRHVAAHVGAGAVDVNGFYHGWRGAKSLESAELNFRQALAIDPASIDAMRGLVSVYWEKGLSEECLKLGKQASIQFGDDADVLMLRADAYVFGGLPDKALPILESIVEEDSLNRAARWLYVVAALWAGMPEKTIDAGERFLEKFGDDAVIYSRIGMAYYALDEIDVARIYLDKAVGSKTAYGATLDIEYGLILQEMGEDERAQNFLSERIEVMNRNLLDNPDNYRQRAMLAALHALLGNREILHEETERLLAGSRVGEELYTLGLAHIYVGEPERALEIFTLTAQSGTNSFYMAENEKILGFDELRNHPDFDACYAELQKLKKRLSSQY